MKSKKIVAALLLVSALVTVVYAQLYTGTMTITTEEVVAVNPIVATFPARSSGIYTETDAITFDYSKGGFAGGETVLVGVELVMASSEIERSFTWLTIQIKDDIGAVVGVLTLRTTYVDFEETVHADIVADPTQTYDIVLIYKTAAHPIVSGEFGFRATILAVY